MSTMENQNAKRIVLDYYSALGSAGPNNIKQTIAPNLAPDYVWRGFHPFGELFGPESVLEQFWMPLIASLTRMQRRQDIFFAGANLLGGKEGVWVVSMGHLMGLFDTAWLGIRPTGKIAMLRYCDFNRVADGKIVETAMFFDIPHLAAQAGQKLFPTQTAAHLVQPGPITHGGLLFEEQPAEEGRATIAAIEAMLSDLGTWRSGLSLADELARTWRDDMLWWGPEGIGATYTIERYAKQHSGPFRAAFSDRSKTTHLARVSEGHFGGFFGWPNFSATLTGPFMGMAPTGKRSEFRVIDIYRREGNKLAENWIFIDLLHFWLQQGIDFLGQASSGT
jgi:predicted ester cyclase